MILLHFLRLTWTRPHKHHVHFMFQRNQLHRNELSTSWLTCRSAAGVKLVSWASPDRIIRRKFDWSNPYFSATTASSTIRKSKDPSRFSTFVMWCPDLHLLVSSRTKDVLCMPKANFVGSYLKLDGLLVFCRPILSRHLLHLQRLWLPNLEDFALRKSPTEWKQAQGAVGNSQQLLYAQVRTLRQDLADRYGTLVPITSPVFTWLVKHSQFLLNNFAIRSDGLTPFERRWSKRYTSALCKFGEVVLCRLRGKQPKADPSWVPGLWLGRDTSADMHVVGTTSGVFKTRSIRRLPVSEQVDKQLLKDFQAKPWDPKGRGEDTDVLVLPQAPEGQGLPTLPVQQTDGTSAVDSSQHGLKRTSDELGDEAQDDEPPNLFQRVGPAQSDLKRSAPDSVPGSETKLQRISAVFEEDSLPVTCACVASISTKSGLDVPIEPNVDREEELQALRAAEPVLWYDTEFDREQEIAGMNKEMTSIKDFDVYEEKLITECTSDQLQNAISTKWVKRVKRRRRQVPCVRSWIRPRGRSRRHLR